MRIAFAQSLNTLHPGNPTKEVCSYYDFCSLQFIYSNDILIELELFPIRITFLLSQLKTFHDFYNLSSQLTFNVAYNCHVI